MKLTPIDIRKQEFKKVMRGYDPVEVDTFMDMVANEFENLGREQKDVRDRMLQAETELKDYRQIEKALQQTLLQAQETTGKSYEAARKESELIIREAELKAAAIVGEANAGLLRLNAELNRLQGRRESLLTRLRALLTAELDLLRILDEGAPVAPRAQSEPGGLPLDDILKDIDDERIAQAR